MQIKTPPNVIPFDECASVYDVSLHHQRAGIHSSPREHKLCVLGGSSFVPTDVRGFLALFYDLLALLDFKLKDDDLRRLEMF